MNHGRDQQGSPSLGTSVALIVFNRPECTARSFGRIRAARPHRLYLIADGPRPDRPGEDLLCRRARGLVEEGLDWPCELVRDYSSVNLGCARRVASGLDAVFAREEDAIILEDDCIPDASFFPFCGELLARYRTRAEVFHIGGANFRRDTRPESYYFSRYNRVWGWATWRRAWSFFDWEMKRWPSLRQTSWLADMMGSARAARYWRGIFDGVSDGSIESWAYRWTYSMWVHEGLAAVSSVNLVENIGFGSDATHLRFIDRSLSRAVSSARFPLKHPERIERDSGADIRTEGSLFSGGPAWRLRRWLNRGRQLIVPPLFTPRPESKGSMAGTFVNGLRAVHARLWRSMGPGRQRSGARKFSAIVVKLDRIGDFVLALSAIRLVTRHFGEKSCALVISNEVVDLARIEFPDATRIVLPAFVRHKRALHGWRRSRSVLSAVSCDHLICLRHHRWDYDELVLSWIRSQRVHAVRDGKTAFWERDRRTLPASGAPALLDEASAESCRELDLTREVLGQLLGSMPDSSAVRPRFEHAGPVRDGGYGVLAPFGSGGLRDLPSAILDGIAADSAATGARKLRLVGSPGQRRRLEDCAERLRTPGGPEVECIASLSLVEFVALIATASWVVTAESGTAHIATALDKPTVVLIGGGHFGQFGPWRRSARQRWLTHALPCFHCAWICIHPEPFCITQISAEDVKRALVAVTSEKPPKQPEQLG